MRLAGTGLELTAIASLVAARLLELRDRRLSAAADRWLLESTRDGHAGVESVFARVRERRASRRIVALPKWLLPVEAVAVLAGVTLTTWASELASASFALPEDQTDGGRAIALAGWVLAIGVVALFLWLRAVQRDIVLHLQLANKPETLTKTGSDPATFLEYASERHDTWGFAIRYLSLVLVPLTIVFLTWSEEIASVL